MSSKLDPELRRRLANHRRGRRAPEAPSRDSDRPAEPPAAERVGLIVEFAGDLADLVAIGFRPRTVLPNRDRTSTLATGTIPVDRLDDLAAIDHVTDTEGPQQYGPLLNYTLPETRGDVVHKATPSRKGEGVVIGVIDSGIDWRHGAFVDPATGDSRILAIWDQMLPAHSTETAGPDETGVVYSKDELTRALKGQAIVRTRDTKADGKPNGHGTHVAGIAAGNGDPRSCCTLSGAYTGLAPAAELLVVRQDYRHQELGENTNIIDGLEWIFDHPGVAGRPVVINISLGVNRGPHDGTSAVERAIDRLVDAAPRRAVVVGAGNFAVTTGDAGEIRCHVQGTVLRNSDVTVEFSMRSGHNGSAWIDIWYDRAGELDIDVSSHTGNPSGTVTHGQDREFIADPNVPENRQVTVDISGTADGDFSRNHNFRITIQKPESGSLPTGDPWNFKLINRAPDRDVGFHAWIERGTTTPTFLPEVATPDGKIRASTHSTISIPSTARRAISVASHFAKTDCCDCFPKHGLAASSGVGPVVREALANPKPTIAAPGVEVTSAKADAANLRGNCCSCCPDLCCCLYEPKDGTSMAAPHVTGAIALMYQANPNLTRDEIDRHLRTSARPRPPGNLNTPEAWGAGYLNADGAVQAVLAALPPGGGGGGGQPPFVDDGPLHST